MSHVAHRHAGMTWCVSLCWVPRRSPSKTVYAEVCLTILVMNSHAGRHTVLGCRGEHVTGSLPSHHLQGCQRACTHLVLCLRITSGDTLDRHPPPLPHTLVHTPKATSTNQPPKVWFNLSLQKDRCMQAVMNSLSTQCLCISELFAGNDMLANVEV